MAYPQINIPTQIRSEAYALRSPVSWEEFERLQKPIKEVLDEDLPLLPGVEFGQLSGKISGSLTEIAWIWPWTCLIRKSTLSKINNCLGTKLDVCPANIAKRRKDVPDYFELIALPLAELTEERKTAFLCGTCPHCRWYVRSSGEIICVKHSSVPKKRDIFRINGLSRDILCSERFRHAVVDLRLTNIEFEPVEIAEE